MPSVFDTSKDVSLNIQRLVETINNEQNNSSEPNFSSLYVLMNVSKIVETVCKILYII